ncbi:DUF2470 domain-containing protein [Streptomyces sp. NPDC002889]|uniref:DUF2470 domain-containing protein n=1 Tax=Streptomyces sp. NPDC002889 TaxID=3364669 RepID=UPI0036870C08
MPSAAERTRTLVQSTSSAVLLVPGLDSALPEQLMPQARAVGTDGEVFLLFPADSPAVRAATHAQDDELSAVLEITDVAPVSVPHRIRGRAWVRGWLTCVPGLAAPGSMMLRLEVGEADVDDLWGSESVEPEAFARALVDPLVAHETELLQHLHAAHSDQMQGLCELLGDRSATRLPQADGTKEADRTGGPGQRAVPLALDRFGLRVRFTGEQCFDARFDFPTPVRDIAELRRAMHTLFAAAAH